MAVNTPSLMHIDQLLQITAIIHRSNLWMRYLTELNLAKLLSFVASNRCFVNFICCKFSEFLARFHFAHTNSMKKASNISIMHESKNETTLFVLVVFNKYISDRLTKLMSKKLQVMYVKYNPKVILPNNSKIHFEYHLSSLSLGITLLQIKTKT